MTCLILRIYADLLVVFIVNVECTLKVVIVYWWTPFLGTAQVLIRDSALLGDLHHVALLLKQRRRMSGR